MENFFKFFDELSVEESQYWRLTAFLPRVESLPDDHIIDAETPQNLESSIELLWQRSQHPFSWSYRPLGTSEWIASSTVVLEQKLVALGVSREHLQNEITSNIMTQVVHAHMVVDAVQKLLGPHLVHQATRQTQDFLSSLQSMTETLLAPHAPKPPLGKGHLTLVAVDS